MMMNEWDKLEMEMVNDERMRLGFNPLPADVDTSKKSQHMVQVSNEAWDALVEMARDLGYEWGANRGSVGRLLEAIGQGLYELRAKRGRQGDM